jgi:class 3 adenylate cyclase
MTAGTSVKNAPQDLPMVRRLAAIMAADVAGYSRLMGEDEAGTLAQLKTTRSELIEPAMPNMAGASLSLWATGCSLILAAWSKR